MKDIVLNILPKFPDITKYIPSDEDANAERNLIICDDAKRCMAIIKNNVNQYVGFARMLFDAVIANDITDLNDSQFVILDDIFAFISDQVYSLSHRYSNIEHNSHVESYVNVSLQELSDYAALGLFNEERDNNHPRVIREQATYVFEQYAIQQAKRKRGEQRSQQVAENIMKTMVDKKQEDDSQFQFVKSNTTFKDVAGLKEVKEDLLQIVDFIKRPDVYKKYGAKLPKGTILAGEPGTGKTLLARAVAGESDANFIAVDSTVFCSSHWGESPKKIRELFSKARENAPCIIFIDEIDMLGLDRNNDKANSLAHRESLNAFLSTMDGFNQYEGVTVLAATNTLDDLDPALTRPGRFDNIFTVPSPNNIEAVEEVVNIYIKNKHLDEDLTSLKIARKLLGQSPASIEAILNKACLIAIKNNNGVIREVDFNTALTQHIIKGHIKPVDLEAADTKKTAVHEASHALVAALRGVPVRDVSVLPTSSGAGGLTTFEPTGKHYFTKADYETRILIAYAGRCGEQLAFGEDNVTTGASADIKHATQLIRDAASRYGFNLSDSESHAPILYSTMKQSNLEKAANKYYKETLYLLKDNYKILYDIAKALLKDGTISGDMVNEIIEKHRTAESEIPMDM